MKSIIKLGGIIILLIPYLATNAETPKTHKQTFGTRNISTPKKNDTLRNSLLLDYTFRDTLGRPVHLSDYRGKFVFIDLWYTGCGFCIYANRALKLVHKRFKSQNIVFLSISVDKDKEKWMQSIKSNALPSKINPWAGKYSPAKGTIILYTGGSGYDNSFVKKYVPENSYPKLLMIDPLGKLITDNPPRPDFSGEDHPQELIAFIKEILDKSKY